MTDIRLCLVNPETFEESKKGELALMINNEVFTTYCHTKVPKDAKLINAIINDAYEYGEQARSKELLTLLGGCNC